MAENNVQKSPSLIFNLDQWKTHQMKFEEENSNIDTSSDTNKSDSSILNKVNNLSDTESCELKRYETTRHSDNAETHSSISNQLDLNLNEDDLKPKFLDEILNLTEEEDLLCKISMQKNDASSDSDSDENHLHFELSESNQDVDPKLMLNDKLCLYEKQKVPALQIGIAIPEPVLNVEEAKFTKSVLQVLKKINFYGPSCIQSVVWPAVERSRDMLVIAPPHSGKTVAYILPLVSRFTSRGEPKENRGPHSVVLCSSWRKVEAVSNHFKLFLGDIKKKIFCLYTNGGHYKNKMQFLINNCDILIATPHCLLEFFERNMVILSRLHEFVVDDGSTVMEKHKKELKEIIIYIMKATKKTEHCPQLILCTERWNKNFQIIVDNIMSNPLIYFTSFLEAAIYAKIKITDHVFDSKQAKMVALCDIIKHTPRRIVIATTNASEASEVHHFVKRFYCQSYLVNENMEHFVADDVIESWKFSGNDAAVTCLVATDQIITDMRISNADCLIHFDIPPKSRLQFGNRFSVIAEHFTKKESKCVCHVLVLESEHRYAMNLIEIIRNSGGTPSEKIIEFSEMKTEDVNISGDLCHYMKAFGACSRSHCKSRHTIVPAIDKPQILPCEGDIHGIVTHVIDASHYFVRLVKYLDPTTNKTVSLVGTYAKIGFQLRNFYSHISKNMKVESPVIGETYVLEEENKLFYRVKILGFIPESSTHIAQWRVLFLDEGWVKNCKMPNLYKIMDEIDLPQPLAVEVYACNMAPPDSFFDWNTQTSLLVSDLIKGKEIHGKIVLCIEKTLWLNPLAITVKLCDGNYVYPFKIDQKLLDYGHVVKRKSHLESLLKACTGKITLPHITKSNIKEENDDDCESSINYAFLDCGVYEDVYVSCVVSPDQLYVQRAKFVNCLDDLLDKIDVQVKERKLKRAYTVFKDMICVAPFHEDNRYYRAIVTNLLTDDKVQVHFVDFGDSGIVTRKDIFSISAECLLLPFQAIECELADISAPHGGWTESAISTLTALTRDEASDMKILHLKAYSKTSSYTSGNHYVIDLWDDNHRKLSEQLLQAGFCIPKDSSTEVYNDVQCNNDVFELNDEFSLSSDDEDMHPDEKNAAAQFYGFLARKLAEHYDLFPLPEQPSTEDVDEILKNCNISSLPASNSTSKNFENLLPKLSQIKKFLPSQEPPPESVRPLITWWDTPEELNILINLKDVKIYELNVTDETLSFNTIIAGVQYSTDENFYEKIISRDAKTNHIIQGISVIAKKSTSFKWPRLTKEKKKFFHIKYDLLHIEDSDSDENSTSAEGKSNIKPDMRYEYDEDDSNTDEEETYVEPWKDFAENKDSINDLLTEM